jgi:hypothetical protein
MDQELPSPTRAQRHQRPRAMMAGAWLWAVVLCLGCALVRVVVPYPSYRTPLKIGPGYVNVDSGLLLASVAINDYPDCSPLQIPVHSCWLVQSPVPGPKPTYLTVWGGMTLRDTGSLWLLLKLPLP